MKFISSSIDGYEVRSDEGMMLGEVRKWSQSYNLSRPITVRGWKAKTPDGKPVDAGTHSNAFSTRREAGEALVKIGKGRDYFTSLDREGMELGKDIPMRCNDCNRPAYYDEADNDYHHALDPARGCFLIESETRLGDYRHPLLVKA